MKIMFLISLLVLCMGMGSRPPTKPASAPSKPVAVPGDSFLSVSKCDNCTVAEFDYIKAATAKTNEVVSGVCFREKLSAMPLIQTDGRSPQQVVDSLVDARITIEAEMYWTAKRVLGYTLKGVDKEWINRRYMLRWGHCDLGSLLAHETSHKVGYAHDYRPTKQRPNSVPYSVNRAFEACCAQ